MYQKNGEKSDNKKNRKRIRKEKKQQNYTERLIEIYLMSTILGTPCLISNFQRYITDMGDSKHKIRVISSIYTLIRLFI